MQIREFPFLWAGIVAGHELLILAGHNGALAANGADSGHSFSNYFDF